MIISSSDGTMTNLFGFPSRWILYNLMQLLILTLLIIMEWTLSLKKQQRLSKDLMRSQNHLFTISVLDLSMEIKSQLVIRIGLKWNFGQKWSKELMNWLGFQDWPSEFHFWTIHNGIATITTTSASNIL